MLQNALETSYLDAYIETIENFIDQYRVRVIDGVPSEADAQRLEAIYKKIRADTLKQQKKRRKTCSTNFC
mgnify:CR=1 FL=1